MAGAALLTLALSLDPPRARADEEPSPASESALVILDKLHPSSEPPIHPTDYLTVATNDADFEAEAERQCTMPLFITGAVICQSTPCEDFPAPVPGEPSVKGWATVYDQETLDCWNQNAPPAEFMTEIHDPPSLNDAVFDLDVIAPDADGVEYHLKLRVRASDGAAGVVYMVPTAMVVPVQWLTARCEAGFWWQFLRICCYTEGLTCNFIHLLLPALCTQCNDCFNDCYYCRVGNPCHACHACGASGILCHWFGRC